MLRFYEVDVMEAVQHSDFLVMDCNIWKQGREYFKHHRYVEKIPVKNKDGEIICYAFQDADANRELRMLQELIEERQAIHFESIYPEYDCVEIQGCNELAYYFRNYLESRGIIVKVSGKYWSQIGIFNSAGRGREKRVLTVYAEGTWNHSEDLSYELIRTVSVEWEYIDNVYKENIKQGIIKNASYGYPELISKLKDKNIILLGVENTAQDIYDMLVSEGLDIVAFLDEGKKGNLKLLGKEIIGIEDIDKFGNIAFIQTGKNSALGMGKLDEYVYYGCKRNESFFFFEDYIDVQRANLRHILREKTIVLIGDKLLSRYMKRYMANNWGKDDSVFYYKNFKDELLCQDTIGVIVVSQYFAPDDSFIKWKKEIDTYLQILKEYQIENYTLYFTRTSSFIRMDTEEEKYRIEELKPKGILMGVINAYSGNIFFRDCIDNHPNIIQFGFSLLENDLFMYCIRLAQLPVDEIVPALLNLYRDVVGEEWFKITFPNVSVFREKCNTILSGRESVTSQELFVLFAIAYNEMMGRKVNDITNTYIYWEPHAQELSLKIMYENWFIDRKINGIIVYIARNGLSMAGSALNTYVKKKKRKINYLRMLATMLDTPYILSAEGVCERVFLKFEEIKLKPRETWEKLCAQMGISYSDTFLETTRFGKESYYDNGVKQVTGYDLTPVYNDYADIFSLFDKMRICISRWEYQRKFGYLYEDVSFTRKELQELFLKNFKCESVLGVEGNRGDYIEGCMYLKRRLNKLYIELFWDELRRNSKSDGTVSSA